MSMELSELRNADFFDSRDVMERIAELLDTEDADEMAELATLQAFEDEANGGDWRYGITFVADSYFTEYAQEMAEEIGAIDPNASWPLSVRSRRRDVLGALLVPSLTSAKARNGFTGARQKPLAPNP